MKILLTGASGFVGSAVLRRLIKENFNVKVLIRETSNTQLLRGLDVERFIGDLSDENSLETALNGCDTLIHTAADYRLWTPNPEEVMRSNVTGTKNIIKAASKANLTRIVYTSSVAALGSTSKSTLVTEETPSFLEGKIGAYKQSKFLAEASVYKAYQENEIPVVIVNPSAPIGPRDIKPTPTGRLVVQAALGKIPAYVDSGLNIVHVDDVANGHILALKKGKIGEKYILGGENMTFLEILTMVANIVGNRPPKIRMPTNLMLPIAQISEIWAKHVSGKEPFATVDGVKMSKTPMYYSSEKAKTELGYTHRPPLDAFIDAISWFEKFGYVK